MVQVKVIKDKVSGLPAGKISTNIDSILGYGFIEFADHEIARKVLATLNGSVIPGTTKNFKLNWASYGTMAGKTSLALASAAPATPLQEYSVYVSDLDVNVNDSILFQVFSSKYTTVVSAKVVTDMLTRKSKCYGFVKFTSYEESLKAIQEMNN